MTRGFGFKITEDFVKGIDKLTEDKSLELYMGILASLRHTFYRKDDIFKSYYYENLELVRKMHKCKDKQSPEYLKMVEDFKIISKNIKGYVNLKVQGFKQEDKKV